MHLTINIHKDADLAATIAALEAIGSVTTPTSTVRCVTLECTDPAGVNEIPGVETCVNPDDLTIELSVCQSLTPQQWGQGYVSNPADHSQYCYGADGAGILIGNLDTPAEVSLPEFGGRATKIFDPDPVPNTQFHGTWTLALAGGVTYGMAKGATLVNLAGFDGAGSATVDRLNAGFAAFADYVEVNPQFNGYVLSCSFGASGPVVLAPDPFKANIDRLTALGVWIFAATGNGDANGNGFDLGGLTAVWPANNSSVIAVASHDNAEQRSVFSNYGGNTAIYAPGSAVASITDGGAEFIGSGTSASCPIAAGSAACALHAEVSDIRTWIADNANVGAISGVPSGIADSLHKPESLAGGAFVPPPPEGVTILDGGDATTMAYVFEIDGGDASTVYNPIHVIEEAA